MKKKSKSKEAKFFCESCGSEVPRNSKVCPNCGKFFASVRCPQCGRIGSHDLFKNGCPTCGYAVNPTSGKGSTNQLNNFENNKNNKFGIRRILGLGINRSSKTKNYNDSALPIWVYIVSIMILAALLVGLYSCL